MHRHSCYITLAKRNNNTPANWVCIKPDLDAVKKMYNRFFAVRVTMKMRSERDKKKGGDCGIYDVGNLADKWDIGKPLVGDVGGDQPVVTHTERVIVWVPRFDPISGGIFSDPVRRPDRTILVNPGGATGRLSKLITGKSLPPMSATAFAAAIGKAASYGSKPLIAFRKSNVTTVTN